METSKDLNTWMLMISELTQGRELAKQLQNHLDPSTPHETREFLIQKILSTYNKLLQMANLPCTNSVTMDPNSSQISFHVGDASISPCPDLEINDSRASKKRKTLPKWVETVKASIEEEGVEGSLYDGYSWRKYGQKVILGAAFPRGYYRCTHRRTRGCCATKQVQKSTEDPTLFHVIYRGHHTCSQPTHVSHPSTRPNPPLVPRGLLHPSKPEPAQPDPQLKVETTPATGFVSAPPATLDSNPLPRGNAGENGGWTPESDVNNEQGGSDPGSPFGRFGNFDFTLDELEIDPNFPFDEFQLF